MMLGGSGKMDCLMAMENLSIKMGVFIRAILKTEYLMARGGL